MAPTDAEAHSLEAGADYLHRLLLVQRKIPSVWLELGDIAQLVSEFVQQNESTELGRFPRQAECP